MKNKILFVGTFLSAYTGTASVSENIANKFKEFGFKCKTVSHKRNKLARLIDIITELFLYGPKVIHVDVFSGQAFIITEITAFIGKILKRKLIFTLHGGALPDFYSKNAKRINRAFKRAEIITTPSRMLQRFFEEKGFEVRYIPNPIELKHFPYKRDSVRPYSLLWVRAFHPIYNPLLAIHTLAKIKESFPEATLTMIGPDKGMLNKTKELIKELNLDQAVEIIGPVPNTELYRYYQTHAVFLNTTSYESFGVAVLEAAACGIPVVSVSVGEIPFLWEDGKNLLLAESYDQDVISSKIDILFKNCKLANQISINARKKAEKFDLIIILNDWLNVYSKIC
ncbi:hypothetical protein JCM31826_08210 [Thermaurantimonas aggregans]|uniref:Glycosyl transferase family 1 domain-containing protein n=1 Tax=Thermaurantimonas aggregans TaxID=2173829 RepID=A0A401XJZ3_9FLAO|nr:glycosyltransferase family 4 protein [Thermaurantimonas aggregans]GCD77339.1 hypothetical protein JCM31826_08210 [Thermaurantimonas aggregans]